MVTEKEILRHIAAAYTKTHAPSLEESKTFFAEHLKLCHKVYLSFCKFIHTQVNKGKTVDTGIIGAFTKDNKYYPSPEFVNAAKLRVSKSVKEELQGKEYEAFFGAIQSDLTLSYSSIATACGTTAEMVNLILKDFFERVADVVRRNKGSEVRLSLHKETGALIVSSNRQISLQTPLSTVGEDFDSISAYCLARTQRDGSDVASVIDSASAALSQRGSVFSVKSGFLSNITV